MRDLQFSVGQETRTAQFCGNIADTSLRREDVTLKINFAAARQAAREFENVPVEELIERAQGRLEYARLTQLFPKIDSRFAAIAILNGVRGGRR
jgi:hypothetical protein